MPQPLAARESDVRFGHWRRVKRESAAASGPATVGVVRYKEEFFRHAVFTADIATLTVSYLFAYWLRDQMAGKQVGLMMPVAEYIWILWIILPTWLAALNAVQLYDSGSYASRVQLVRKLTKAHIVASLVLLSAMYLLKQLIVSRLFLDTFVAITLVTLAAEKLGIRSILRYLASRRDDHLIWKVLIVGAASDADGYLRLLRDQPHWRVETVGIIEPPAQTVPFAARDGGRTEYWTRLLKDYITDEVIAVSTWREAAWMDGLAQACAEKGVTFRVFVKMPPTNVGRYRVDSVGSSAYLLSLEVTQQNVLPLLIKRGMDAFGAILGLSICGAVYLLYRRRLQRESPGPVLFRQQRIGQNGRQFTLYKFRTMCPDAEQKLAQLLPKNQMNGQIFKIKDDPRVLRAGHLLRMRHLDELPQCWNVLKGEMSLVGTRPPTPTEVTQYRTHHYRRLSMKPGITGLWQLNGNAGVRDFEDVVRLDCEYIDNWSLLGDLAIMAKTVGTILRGGGW